MSWLDVVHGRGVHLRRVRVLAAHLAGLIPPNARVLDVGTGDGWLAHLVAQLRQDIRVLGLDTLVRPNTHIPVQPFDGSHIPYPDHSFDVVMFIDVLHHTTNVADLLAEATRVTKSCIVIKDHQCENRLDHLILSFMDRVGNLRHGVTLPYNYLSQQEWADLAARNQIKTTTHLHKLGLYPWLARWLFEGKLHFLARWDKQSPA